MIYVFSSHVFSSVSLLRDILEQNNVPCLVKNEHLLTGVGELPPIAVWPELWIMDDAQEGKAKALVDAFTREATVLSPWCCPRCNESLEGQFGDCWNCGTSRPLD